MIDLRALQIILLMFLVVNEIAMIGRRTLFNYIRHNMDPLGRHNATPTPGVLAGLKRKIFWFYLGNIATSVYIIVTLIQTRTLFLDVMPHMKLLLILEAAYVTYLLVENLLCNPLTKKGDPHTFALRYYALRNRPVLCWIYPALEKLVYYSSFLFLVVIGVPLLFR